VYYAVSVCIVQGVRHYIEPIGRGCRSGVLRCIEPLRQAAPIQHLHAKVMDRLRFTRAERQVSTPMFIDPADVRMVELGGGLRLTLKLIEIAGITEYGKPLVRPVRLEKV
jgi:hypothetical protein